MPWSKGKSGNPGGRPKGAVEIKSLCQENSPEAMKRIFQLMKSKDERVALAAAQTVLDRGYGKPTQHVEANVSFMDKLTEDEQCAVLAALETLARDASGSEAGTSETHH